MQTIDDQTTTEVVSANLPQDVVKEMRAATPWMKLMSVLGFIYCLFLIAGAVFTIYAARMTGAGVIAFMPYVIVALLVFFPNLFLMQYASNINKYSETKGHLHLRKAFIKQKKLWRFVGVATVIVLLLMVMFMVMNMMMGNILTGIEGY